MSWFKSNVLETNKKAGIYGAEWDGSSSTVWLRTDDAALFAEPIPQMSNGSGGWTQGSSPFDEIMPWAGMVVSEDSNAGTVVAIPKFYFKLGYANETSPYGLKIQISSTPFEGAMVSPAHQDRGDGVGERDIVYVGRYHCASDYKSKTGVTPYNNQTRGTFRNGIHNLGSNIWQWDYAILFTIQMLYLVEYANWDSEGCIGYGCGNGSSVENMGSTDSMTYHTGTNQTSRTTYGHTQYRNIEDLWGNVFDWCDGIYFSSSNVYAIKNPSSFSDTTGGTLVGTRPTSSACTTAYGVSSTDNFTWFMYPSAVGGSEATYIPDYCNYSSSGVVLFVGGKYGQYLSHGLFYLSGSYAAVLKYSDIGSRVMKT